MGFEAVSVNNGDEAMELLSGDPYFVLIITDIMMPFMKGFEFTKKLKEYTETKDIPVIATSAFHNWKKARDEYDLMVDGFIQKPILKETLQKEIKRVLADSS